MKINPVKATLAVSALSLAVTLGLGISQATAMEGESMMMAPTMEKPAMDKPDMGKPAMEKMEKSAAMLKEATFTEDSFMAATQSGETFLVAFHKKNCALCIAQKKALNEAAGNPAFQNVKVLVVEYPTDKASLEKFDIDSQGTLILFRDGKEISRSDKLTDSAAIINQVKG